VTIIFALLLGFLLTRVKKENRPIVAKDGFIIVTLSWTIMSLVGALPFVISGSIPSYLDAVFETLSGFSTTGSTIINDIEALSNSILFWRSFTHWLGGMGILLFMLAFLPMKGESTIHLLRAESPGPKVSKIVPRMKDTAILLYVIYCALTLALFVLLWAGGMPFFDSVIHAVSTAGTGGYSLKNSSIAYYNSDYITWVITTFMFLFGINFNVYFLIIMKRAKEAFKISEIKHFLFIFFGAILAITLNIWKMYGSFYTALKYSAFSVATMMSTTGYAVVDFDLWPGFSKIILVSLMFVGGCAGSTSGGMKVSRLALMFTAAKANLKKMANPRSVQIIKVDGKIVNPAVINDCFGYLVFYVVLMVLSMFIVSLDNFDFQTTTTAVISAINNVGPGLGGVGPTCNFANFSNLSKLVFCIDMLAGRLEIMPVVIFLLPGTWKKY
ncbi:MAG: TrkH family potassium uptake protein, partial [Firmicutes bacterium]|nr:TrkH family potassium uptake protein [Bacillota bacterium]